MSEEKENNTKLADIDESLKGLIVRHWDSAITFRVKGDFRSAFESYKALLSFILPYEFTSKESLMELCDSLDDHFLLLSQSPKTMRERIRFGKDVYDVKQLLDILQLELPMAYKELNLWLKSVAKHPDLDSQFSVETFNSDISTLDQKKKELLDNLDLELAFNCMSRQEIHNLYARYIFDLAVKKEQENKKEDRDKKE